mgnify:CR=1 FL=1
MLKVLLVDDEPFILQGIKVIIDWEKEGFEIVGTAGNGSEAVEFLKSNPVDLILADIKMPVMNGLEWTARSVDDEKTFEPGMIVMVKEIKGVTLYVTESSDMPQMNGDK